MFLIVIPYLTGIVCMAVVLALSKDRFKLRSLSHCIAFAILLAIVGFCGAKLLYTLENLSDGIIFTLSGLSMFGGVWAVPLVMPLFSKPLDLSRENIMDASGPCGAIILGFMRIGCFLSGCCGATPIILKSGVQLILPVQLIETAYDFALAAFLLRSKKYGARNGQGFSVAMIGYCIVRFFLEFLRDTPKLNGFLSQGQWYSLLTVVIGLSMFWSQQAVLEKRSAAKPGRRTR